MKPAFRRCIRARRRGYSLVEMIVAVIVAGVLLSIGVPRFQRSLEQSRADVAGANLRAIWSAQRLYWLQNRTYATDLSTLVSANLIDPSLPGANVPYSYSIADASDTGSPRRRPAAVPRAGAAASRSPPMGRSPELCSNRARAFPWSRDSSEIEPPRYKTRSQRGAATRCSRCRSLSRSWASASRACARSW